MLKMGFRDMDELKARIAIKPFNKSFIDNYCNLFKPIYQDYEDSDIVNNQEDILDKNSINRRYYT